MKTDPSTPLASISNAFATLSLALQLHVEPPEALAEMQKIRDVVTGDVTLDYLARRSAEGWRISGIEWTREGDADAVMDAPANPDQVLGLEGVPYGLRFAEPGARLEENPFESQVLLLILEQVIKERRVAEIARDLNVRGYATRAGTPWSAANVFDLMPRLIEIGPALLKSATWQQRRPALAHKTEAGSERVS